MHCHGCDRNFLSDSLLATQPSTGEDLHCMCCSDLCLEPNMARVTVERAPAFTSAELERLVDGVLPQYGLLHGPPDQQVSTHQKNGLWHAIAKGSAVPGGLWQAEHPLSELVGGPEMLGTEGGGCPTGDGLPTTKGCPGVGAAIDPVYPLSLSPFLFCHLSLCALASSGGGAEALATEGAASHRTHEAESTDGEGTRETEGEGSSTAEPGGDSSDTDTFSDGGSLVVADTSATTPATGTSASPRTSTALPAAPQRAARARSPRRVGISFAPDTSGPAPISPAALSEEAIDLLTSISVGQSTNVNAIQGLAAQMKQTNAFLEGIHTGLAAQQRSI
ncbi:hypothetical protein NDU88_005729 [Pleurodeles waltl]|uniref:Uncharacterized protein n=1 Tax=Pleurodeles waltl TaxID=8319 RepID=A0AAV7TBK1_PLEWA|nr:hypothetical protein NDU88_005729 [Pleurodeles waltl]